MSALVDITGQRFGRLVALRRHPEGTRGRSAWICVCDCGTIVTRRTSDLRTRGPRQSCGCELRERAERFWNVMRPLKRRWHAMKARCQNSSHASYRNYGGRGIAIAPEWESFDAFAQWAIENGFDPKLQIDRIDNDGPYAPENCRWVTPSENMSNRRTNRIYEFEGRLLTIKQASIKYDIPDSTLEQRLSCGVPPMEAVDPTHMKRRAKGLSPA